MFNMDKKIKDELNKMVEEVGLWGIVNSIKHQGLFYGINDTQGLSNSCGYTIENNVNYFRKKTNCDYFVLIPYLCSDTSLDSFILLTLNKNEFDKIYPNLKYQDKLLNIPNDVYFLIKEDKIVNLDELNSVYTNKEYFTKDGCSRFIAESVEFVYTKNNINLVDVDSVELLREIINGVLFTNSKR